MDAKNPTTPRSIKVLEVHLTLLLIVFTLSLQVSTESVMVCEMMISGAGWASGV